VKAVAKFPSICGENGPHTTKGPDNSCKKELATMFAHMVQETGMHDNSAGVEQWRQGLYWITEIGCSDTASGSNCDY